MVVIALCSHRCNNRALLRVKILLLTDGGILQRIDNVIDIAIELLLIEFNLRACQLTCVHWRRWGTRSCRHRRRNIGLMAARLLDDGKENACARCNRFFVMIERM